jgi:hypothetical protein
MRPSTRSVMRTGIRKLSSSLLRLLVGPTLRRTSALVTEWSLVSVSLVTSGLTRVMFWLPVRDSITPGPGRTKQDDSSAKDYWSVHE